MKWLRRGREIVGWIREDRGERGIRVRFLLKRGPFGISITINITIVIFHESLATPSHNRF